MSVQGRSGEIERATANVTISPSTNDPNLVEVEATEDREIVGMTVSTDQPVRVVVGFSTSENTQMLAPPTGGPETNGARSQVITAADLGSDEHLDVGLMDPVEWSRGEGLHVGGANSDVDNSKLIWVVVYYREI